MKSRNRPRVPGNETTFFPASKTTDRSAGPPTGGKPLYHKVSIYRYRNRRLWRIASSIKLTAFTRWPPLSFAASSRLPPFNQTSKLLFADNPHTKGTRFLQLAARFIAG